MMSFCPDPTEMSANGSHGKLPQGLLDASNDLDNGDLYVLWWSDPLMRGRVTLARARTVPDLEQFATVWNLPLRWKWVGLIVGGAWIERER
ncbi:hypothetical protein [Rubellimicrobium arenae]|uniref:hypothetical protein n=1 Tax=Rubellimicrobium arenae TaxID=2817372 RepID=UPI001B30DEA4|nr:hypothetical protein [Rubellimicrobium arenae]